jgi:LEA14-like dessication related protein
MQRRRFLLVIPAAAAAGCAGFSGMEPVRVQVVDLQPIAGEALELRLLCKLRVHNPNGREIAFSGVSVELTLQGRAVAYGASGVAGSVPAFADTVLLVPVSISAAGLARTVIDLVTGNAGQRIEYALRGKLGSGWGAVPFESSGVVGWPGGERAAL